MTVSYSGQKKRGKKKYEISSQWHFKQDVGKFLRCVQLKAFFHDNEEDSNISGKDAYETLHTSKPVSTINFNVPVGF